MTKRKAQWIIGLAVVVTIAIAAISLLWPFITKTITVEGTITWLDPATRRASFEFVVPWKGEFMELQSVVADDCDIRIGKQKARMSDIRPGDKATITAKYNQGFKQITPVKVKIESANRPDPLLYWPPPPDTQPVGQ